MSIILIGPKSPGNDETIGVAEVREMIRLLNLRGSTPLIIKNADRMTESAQNAFLKTLEEPPNDTKIILETTSEDLLLPTIRSRCQIVYLENQNPTTSTNLPVFSSISERLALAKEKSTKREEALQFIDDLLVASEKNLVPTNVRILFKAKKYLHANCNVRLVMENLLLSW